MNPSANANATATATDPMAGLSLPDGLTLDNTYGAALLGTFFALIMYGVLLHQTYHYFRVHWADSPWAKLYVVLTLLLDTVHSVVIMAFCYLKLATHYFTTFSPAIIDEPLIRFLTVLTAVHVMACQGFFAYRVYRIGRKSRMVVWAWMVCQTAGLGLCIAVAVDVSGVIMRASFSKYAMWISIPLGIALIGDTVLAAILVSVLHRSRTGIKSTNSLLDTLIAYALTTGVLTDLFNILGLVFALVMSKNFYYAAMNILVTKVTVYTISVMAALNFRKPREPVGNCTTIGGSDLRAAHISLSEMSQSRDIAPRSKAPSNTVIPPHSRRVSGNVLHIKVETESTSTTDSPGLQKRAPGELELGGKLE